MTKTMGIQYQSWHIFSSYQYHKDTRNVSVSNTKKKSIIIKFIAFAKPLTDKIYLHKTI